MDEKERENRENQPFQTPPVQPYRPPQMGTFRSPVPDPVPSPDATMSSAEPPAAEKWSAFGEPPTAGREPEQEPEIMDAEGPATGFPPPPEPPRPQRRRSILGPAFLILLGTLFLLHNLGLIGWSVWEILWRFWPAWLVIIGVDMLVGRRGRWGGILALALAVTLVGGAFYAASVVRYPTASNGVPEAVSQPLNGAREARIELAPSVSRLEVRGGDLADALVQGSVLPLHGEQVRQSYDASGSTAYYRLESQWQNRVGFFGGRDSEGRWELTLNDSIPLALNIQTGVSRSEIDLTNLQVTDLRVESGVGETILTLPAKGPLRAQLSSGVGQTIIRLPKGLAARIRVSTGIGGVSTRGDFVRQGDTFTTANYSTATDPAEIAIEGGVGAIRIEEVD